MKPQRKGREWDNKENYNFYNTWISLLHCQNCSSLNGIDSETLHLAHFDNKAEFLTVLVGYIHSLSFSPKGLFSEFIVSSISDYESLFPNVGCCFCILFVIWMTTSDVFWLIYIGHQNVRKFVAHKVELVSFHRVTKI